MSELTNLVAKQNEESYQLGKKHGAIEELENIKAEIEDIEEPDHNFEGFYYGIEQALKIIDNHINEIKSVN